MLASARRLSAVWEWPLLVLAGLAMGLWPAPGSLVSPTDRHFRIEASQFAYAPATLYANLGDRITIDVVATDVEHGLYLDGYDLNVIAPPGQTAHLSFIADRAGDFRFRCSVTCGALHPFTIGKLNVGSNWPLVRAAGLAMLAVMAGLRIAWRPGPHALVRVAPATEGQSR